VFTDSTCFALFLVIIHLTSRFLAVFFCAIFSLPSLFLVNRAHRCNGVRQLHKRARELNKCFVTITIIATMTMSMILILFIFNLLFLIDDRA
jgi:hypothetical protein